MSDPLQPSHQPLDPGVPPPPPKLNAKVLWITLLGPPLAMALGMLVMVSLDNSTVGNNGELVFGTIWSLAAVASAIAYGFFIHTIYQRFRGTSLVLMIIAYPILEGIIMFAIFFVGCLAAFSY